MAEKTHPKVIPGIALKLMRVSGERTTTQMAALLNKKSRKTIENWEAENSEPTINDFLKICDLTGYDASKVIAYLVTLNLPEKDGKAKVDLWHCRLEC